jgi:O-antigen/teichoic acid export membrane protein
MKDVKEKAIRGGLAKVCAQGANLALRVGSLMVLARLLNPKDFGLVGMVTAFTGILGLFRDFGLSTAAVQRASISNKQISTLFWINVLVGVSLTVLLTAMGPFIAAFYHEPRLFWVCAALSTSFLFNAAGIQHSALLQRQMRFTALATIDIVCLVVSISLGIVMAVAGCGYWALVGMTLVSPIITTLALWGTTRWIPGAPHRNVGIRSLIRFGGTITLNGVVVYIAYNLEKVLLGRFWGAEAIGIYGRAYQLVSIPTDNLNSSVGEVAFSGLSRVQDDPSRLKGYFLKGYSLILGLTIPIALVSVVFARELIVVVLGPKWAEAVPVFRLLTPTILTFAMINPFAWLLFSTGRVERSLKIALVIAPLVMTGYLIGLPYGPKGVALGYSVAMALWVLPNIAWCIQGTAISFWDVLRVISRPLVSGIVALALPCLVQLSYGRTLPPLPGLVTGGTLFIGVYVVMLMYVMGQKGFYLDLVRRLRQYPSVKDEALASASV